MKASRIPEARPAALLLGGRFRVSPGIDLPSRGYSVDERYLCFVQLYCDTVQGRVAADLCSWEVRDERPPKDEAMVLNSTCLIWSPAPVAS